MGSIATPSHVHFKSFYPLSTLNIIHMTSLYNPKLQGVKGHSERREPGLLDHYIFSLYTCSLASTETHLLGCGSLDLVGQGSASESECEGH